VGAVPSALNLVSSAAATWQPCNPWGQEWTTLSRWPWPDSGSCYSRATARFPGWALEQTQSHV